MVSVRQQLGKWREDLINLTLLFGWNRRGSDIAAALTQRVESLVRRGIVEYDGEGPLKPGPKMPEELLRGDGS